ncbi:MAG TPA: diguanylate cyclase [Steroidobacteraceae bacterium]|nr:diguanylate cyclase [Steroidobacteraceae bacterium]
MPLYLPASFLLLQLLLLLFARPIAGPASYIVMVIAPQLAAVTAIRRAHLECAEARFGWSALALALLIWSLGAFGNLWMELVRHHQNEMYRDAMLAFNLAVVPTTFLLATDWRLNQRWLVRGVDALVALTLGYVYFRCTWTMISDHAGPAESGVTYLVWLLDLQNLYIPAAALTRWYAAETRPERDLFRALSVYGAVYMVIVFVNDHWFAGNPAFGPEYGSIVSLAFAVLSFFALRPASMQPIRQPDPALARAVRSGSPIVLALALLVASLFLVRVDYLLGCVGVGIAVIGIGVRTTLIQVLQLQRGEALQRQTSALQAMAWTDALTGVPNRHFFAEAVSCAWRRERRSDQPQAILMIDIDHFKALNDRYGHPAGDACLRQVARALQACLPRPDDVLARYGGEEFIVLLHDTDSPGAEAVAERLRATVEGLQIEHAGSPIGRVTASVGIATAPLTGEAAAARLTEEADRALYEAKCAGRNVVKLATSRSESGLYAMLTGKHRIPRR